MSYLARRSERLAFEDLKKMTIFGIAISTMFAVIGGWNYFFVIKANDLLFGTMAVAGVLGWIVTLVLPSLWTMPERALGFLMRKVGGAVFAVLLTIVYGVLFVPVGMALRKFSGSGPIATWDAAPPAAGLEGWQPKEVVFEAQIGRVGKANLLRQFVGVVQFFVRRGLYIFLPTLIALLAAGLALFFVKSSALAPFIYTLF